VKDDLLALIISNMPEDLRRTLLDNLDIVFPGAIKHADTSAEGFSNTFLAVHMSWYNRFSEHVCSVFTLFRKLNRFC
jgi:hypothetical protein